MSMSTNITALQGALAHDEADKTPSFFGRLFKGVAAAREAQAKRYVQAHLNGLSDLRLKDLGFTEAEIREIRATKQIPASYWL